MTVAFSELVKELQAVIELEEIEIPLQKLRERALLVTLKEGESLAFEVFLDSLDILEALGGSSPEERRRVFLQESRNRRLNQEKGQRRPNWMSRLTDRLPFPTSIEVTKPGISEDKNGDPTER